jgi:hypothetical protein
VFEKSRVGQNHVSYIYGVYTVFLAGKSPSIRSYTVYIYGSGQPLKKAIAEITSVMGQESVVLGLAMLDADSHASHIKGYVRKATNKYSTRQYQTVPDCTRSHYLTGSFS